MRSSSPTQLPPMYATRTRRIKTDRRDARALADANLLGAYRPAHRLSDAPRQVRGRLGVREALVRTRTRSIALSRARLRQLAYSDTVIDQLAAHDPRVKRLRT